MELDFSKLTRDYRINPLKRGETIPKEDLQYLFIDLNLTLKQMSKIINRHPNQIGRQCKEKNVLKTTRTKSETTKTLNVACPINEIQNLMIQKFSGVILNFENELFKCDFYIPEKDLYILYNVGEEHGGKEFDPSNLKHWEIIKDWAEKAQNSLTNKEKNYYTNLINTWTVTDILRRNTLQKNKINYIEFFTKEDFLNWLS